MAKAVAGPVARMPGGRGDSFLCVVRAVSKNALSNLSQSALYGAGPPIPDSSLGSQAPGGPDGPVLKEPACMVGRPAFQPAHFRNTRGVAGGHAGISPGNDHRRKDHDKPCAGPSKPYGASSPDPSCAVRHDFSGGP